MIMAIDIERKFLVKGDFSKQVCKSERMVQGYICSQPGRTVRIRIRGEEGFLTIKGASDENGLSRYEFEQKIPPADAEELLKLCEPGIINKTRYLVKAGDTIEIKENKKGSQRYKEILEATAGNMVPEWLEADAENLKGTVKELPAREAIDVPVDEMLIVELYSK